MNKFFEKTNRGQINETLTESQNLKFKFHKLLCKTDIRFNLEIFDLQLET